MSPTSNAGPRRPEQGNIYVSAGRGIAGDINVVAEDMYIEAPANASLTDLRTAVYEDAPALYAVRKGAAL